MRYLICIFVVSITGLLGGEGKDISTRTEDVTATCTQETDYSNNITLWCNLETFKCSSEDTQLKFKIRKPSIRKSCRKRVFTVKQKKTKNFPKIIYCCQEKEQNLTSIIHATAPGTNITALQGSPQPNNTLNQTFSAEQAHHRETEHFIQITEDPKPSGQESTGEKGIQKNKTAKNIGKNEQNKNNKGSKDTRKSNDGKRSPEEGCACGVGVNRADDDDEEDDDDGDDDEDEEDSGKQRRRRSRAVNWKIIVPSVIFTLILPLGTCLLSLWLWKKMKNLQSKYKTGGASTQAQQVCEKKQVVTIYSKASDPGDADLPPMYDQLDHLYQEISHTPGESAEFRDNPLYDPTEPPPEEMEIGTPAPLPPPRG